MEPQLNPVEIRVLGCLIEKEIATPEYYPLSLNALVNACNQKSNRDPVMTLDPEAVIRALDGLRINHQLAAEVLSSESRVPKYRHRFSEKYRVSPAELAVLCELFVRGAQTPGDIRTHASRLNPIEHRDEAEQILRNLGQKEGGPFVQQLPREAGQREQRWIQLLGEAPLQEPGPDSAAVPAAPATDRITALETETAALRAELDELKTAFAEFRRHFE